MRFREKWASISHAAKLRRLALDRLARFAAEDAARAEALAAEVVDAARRARGDGRLERLRRLPLLDVVDSAPDAEAEIDAALERLRPHSPRRQASRAAHAR